MNNLIEDAPSLLSYVLIILLTLMYTRIALLATSSYLFAGGTGILTLVADDKTINVSNYGINSTGTERTSLVIKKTASKSKIGT